MRRMKSPQCWCRRISTASASSMRTSLRPPTRKCRPSSPRPRSPPAPREILLETRPGRRHRHPLHVTFPLLLGWVAIASYREHDVERTLIRLSALEPLERTSEWARGELPETYPEGL